MTVRNNSIVMDCQVRGYTWRMLFFHWSVYVSVYSKKLILVTVNFISQRWTVTYARVHKRAGSLTDVTASYTTVRRIRRSDGDSPSVHPLFIEWNPFLIRLGGSQFLFHDNNVTYSRRTPSWTEISRMMLVAVERARVWMDISLWDRSN